MSSAPAPHRIGPIRTVSGAVHPAPYPNHSPQQRRASGQNENFWPSTPLGQQLSRNSSSQSFDDPAPSASGQFQAGSNQYPAGPSFQNGDFRMTDRATVQRQASPQERAAEADSIANRLNLSDENRIELHRVSQAKPDADLMLHGYCMKLDAQTEDVKGQVTQVFDRLGGIEERTSAGWTLLTEQEKLLKGVINHWLVKPVNGYRNIINRSVDKYIRQNIEKLHLELYLKDPIIKKTVERFVNGHQTTQRGNNLRGLGEAINRGDSLEEYCVKMLNLYAQGKDIKPTNAVRAQFALMRFIYRDIALNNRTAKNDPGFWKELEAELARLVRVNGKERTSPQWEEWYVQMIEGDKKIFATEDLEILPGLNLEAEGESDSEEAIENGTAQA